jgi:tetratricopeptide (TPR) repeat protein
VQRQNGQSNPGRVRLLSILLWIAVLSYNPLFSSSFGTIKTICLFLAAAGILVATRARSVALGQGWRRNFAFLFLITMLASLIRSENVFETLSGSLVFIGAIVIGRATAFSVRNDDHAKNQVMKTILYIGVFQAVLGIGQYYLMEFGPRVNHITDKMKVVGTLGNPEYLAFFLGASFLLAYHRMGLIGNPRIRFLVLGVLAMGLFFTKSRIMGLALAIPMILDFNSKKSLGRKRKLLFISLAISIGAGGWYYLHPNPHTLYGRLLVWMVSANMIFASYGLGTGIGQFHFHFIESLQTVFTFINGIFPGARFLENNAAYADRAHSELLDFAAEGGLLFSALGVFMMAKLFRISKASSLPGFYKAFLTFSAVGFLISSPLHVVPNLIVFVVLGGCLWSESGYEGDEKGGYAYFPKMLLAILFVGISIQLAWADFHLCKSRNEASHGNDSDAEKSAIQGLRLHPRDERLLIQKARLEYRNFRSREALRTLEIISGKPRTVDHYKLKGLALMSLKDFSAAEANYRELERAFPLMITPKYYLGRIALASGEKGKALDYFSQMQKLRALNGKADFDKAFSKSLL